MGLADEVLNESKKIQMDLWVGRHAKEYLASSPTLDLDRILGCINKPYIERGDSYKVSSPAYLVDVCRRQGVQISISDKWIIEIDEDGRVICMTTDHELRLISGKGEYNGTR